MNIKARQHGAVLVISLIILLVLTLIGVSGARGILINERMTFAARDAKIALEVAEFMTRQAEDYIENLSDISAFGSTGWLRTAGNGPDNLFDESVWTDGYSKAETVSLNTPNGTAQLQGRMFIELAGLATDDSDATDVDLSAGKNAPSFGDIQIFKIVARGEGIGGTQRIVVTLYGKEI